MKLKEKLKNIKLTKKKKIIIAVTIAVLSFGGFSVYSSISINYKEKIELEKTFGVYTIPGKEKIFMSGKVEPNNIKKIFIDSEQGQLDKMIVSNGKYVSKSTPLFTCKNESKINEINEINSQIATKKKEKQNTPDEESKQAIDREIKELNNQVANLNKAAYTTIYAPFSGKVYLNAKALEGDLTQPVLTLQSEDFYIKAQVNERDSYKIGLNEIVEITTLANKQKYDGKISYINDIPLDGDELSQNFSNDGSMSQYEVNISLDTQENLKSGLHVQVVALYGSEYRKIPNSSVLKEGNKAYVYKVTDTIANKTEITIVEEKEGYTLVSVGLRENDNILYDIEGRDIEDGQEVIIPSESNSN